MENLVLPAAMDAARTDRDLLVIFGDRGQVEMAPAAFPQQLAREVILVEALHDENDRTLSLSSRRDRSRRPVPVVDRHARPSPIERHQPSWDHR